MWEKKYFEYLDSNDNVISYESEKVKIPYISNKRTGKVRNYIPDLIVAYSDGSKSMIEIKPSRKMCLIQNIKKFDAAREWCKDNHINFVILTEKELKHSKII